MTGRGPVRVSSVLSEAWRNLVTGTSRVLTVTLVLTSIALTCVCADMFAVSRLLAGAQAYRDAGAATFVLVAAGRVDARACDGLGGVDGVVDAGGLRRAAAGLEDVRMPATTIPVYEGTPGMIAATAPGTARGTGILLSDRVAEVLGVGAGGRVVTPSGDVSVRAIYSYPDDGRRAGLGYAALAPIPALGLVDECRVTVWPSSPERVSLLWGTLRDGEGDSEGDSPRLAQLSTRRGTVYEGGQEHDARVSRFAAFVAGAAAAAVGAVTVRRRRLELAAARHLGCGTAAQVGQMLIEAAAPTVVAVVLTVATSAWLVVSPVGAGEPGTLLGSAAGVVALLCCGHLIGVVGATLATRERDLFRYFRHR